MEMLVDILMGWGATAVFLAVGGGGLVRAWFFARRAREVPGIVAGQRRSLMSGGGAGRTGYTPVLQFTTEDGRQWRTSTRMATSPARYKAGEQVTVLYDPNDPDEAVVKGCRGAGLFLALLVLLFLIGLVLLGVMVAGMFG